MASLDEIIEGLIPSYRYPQTVDDIKRSLTQQMNSRFAVEFIPPKYDIKYVTYSRKHPYGGEMNNWTESPSVVAMDFDEMANKINLQKLLSGNKKIKTMPDLSMTMYLNPQSRNLVPIECHEFTHMNINAIPYNLAYIFGQKEYEKMRQKSQFLQSFSTEDIQDLSDRILMWLYDDYHPLPQNRRQDYKIEPRVDKITNFVDSLNWVHDSIENENNIYYKHSDLENSMMDFYEDLINEMDSLP